MRVNRVPLYRSLNNYTPLVVKNIFKYILVLMDRRRCYFFQWLLLEVFLQFRLKIGCDWNLSAVDGIVFDILNCLPRELN